MPQLSFLSLILNLACSEAENPPVINGVLQDDFWNSFHTSLGCWPDHLYAWNKEGTVGIDVFIALPFSQHGDVEKFTVDLSQPGNSIMVETGEQIPRNFCVKEIQTIPVMRVYESISGHLSVQLDQQTQQLGVHIEKARLQDSESQHEVNIINLKFPLQTMYQRKE